MHWGCLCFLGWPGPGALAATAALLLAGRGVGGEGHLEAQGSKSGTGLLPLHPFKNIHPEISMFSLHLPYGICKSLPGNKKKKKKRRETEKKRKKGALFQCGRGGKEDGRVCAGVKWKSIQKSRPGLGRLMLRS